jgi:23S rRNA (uracil747-C5)-methyltransferase
MIPYCQYYQAGQCRSCSWLEKSYAQQCIDKQQACEQELTDVLQDVWLPLHPSAVEGFRNKAKMVVSGHWSKPILGILDSHQNPVELTQCLLYPQSIKDAFEPIRAWITRFQIMPYDVQSKQGDLKYLLLTYSASSQQLMCRFVLSSKRLLPTIQKALPNLQAALPLLVVASVNIQPIHMAVLEGEEEIVLTPQTAITMQLNDIPLYVQPRSFFQTNDVVAAALYRQAQQWIANIQPESLWDLFCGVGGFALHAAQVMQGSITGIEVSQEAIASAQQTAEHLGLTQVQFRALKSDEFARNYTHVYLPEMVLVNPPRRGIGEELCRFLNDANHIQTIIYSSCNPASLASDCQCLFDFKVVRAQVFDMFPHTHHAEVLVQLVRKEA